MNLESQSQERNSTKAPESHFDQYYQQSLEIARGLSRRWNILREKKKENPHFLAGHPLLEEIDLATRPPMTGIQSWFESQIKSVNTQSDPEARSRMMYRVKEDIERIKQKVDALIGGQENSAGADRIKNREKKEILKRSDVNESQSKDFSESLQRLLDENGFKSGDKIIFFAEREREGVLEGHQRDGKLGIRDTSGQPWGIMAIMMDQSGYIRKP